MPGPYPTPGVMLTALRDRFGQAALQHMISNEVVAHRCRIMRMQAVANLWERHIVDALGPAPIYTYRVRRSYRGELLSSWRRKSDAIRNCPPGAEVWIRLSASADALLYTNEARV